jgi:hypothetical protein
MKNLLRYSLVTVLAAVLTIGPVSAAQWVDCGCEAYIDPCSDCCSDVVELVSPATECCGQATSATAPPAEAETVSPVPVRPETLEPAPEQPESEQLKPVQPESKPIEESAPAPAIVPESKPPVVVEPPVEQPVTPAQDDVEDLFDTPAETEAPITPSDPDPLDSLLTPEDEDPLPTVEESTPVEEVEQDDAEPVEEDDPLDDLFGKSDLPAVLTVGGGLQSNANRIWSDNTAKYHCEARLLGVVQGKVVLAQAGGKISRVALRRLSGADLDFVYQQVVAKREMLARQAEAEKLATAWSN